jgi:calcineurin-like phosphoesterase family protein
MDEEMVRRWNDTVRPKDKVYHLGDVVINRKALKILGLLNGEKVLIKGNHDIFKLQDYTPFFKDVRGYHVMNGMILSHIPLHPSALYRFGTNIHGHTHSNRVMKTVSVEKTSPYDPRPFTVQEEVIDPRYYCVCVEQTDFRPILFEDAIKKIQEQGGTVGFKEIIGNHAS